MQLEAIQAVIESAKARGMEPLERLIRRRLPDASPEEVVEAAEVALEIIESIPVFLARASQEAEAQGLAVVIQPLLDHAEEYFLQPMDLIPEMTQGLAGLLDDAYLVLRVLQNLEQGPKPFLDWDLDYPTAFIRGLVGEKVARRLDAMALGPLQEVSQDLSNYWRTLGHQA